MTEDYKDGKLESIRNPEGIWINSMVFRESAKHYEKHGYYCPDPVDSPAWLEYWLEERKRMTEGYSVGGVKITGEHYTYLNFCPIQKVASIKGKRGKKEYLPPDFWDGDYNFFWAREIARNGIIDSLVEDEDERARIETDTEEILRLYNSLQLTVDIHPDYLLGGYNMIVGKSRRRGYSYKSAAICTRNFYTQPKSLTAVAAYEKKYLYPKGLFSMVKDNINFINTNTAFATPSEEIDRQDHIKASFETTQNGKKEYKGLMSEVAAYTFKDNADALRGKDCLDIFFEESGAFGTPGLLTQSYRATEDCVKAGNIKTGLIMIYGCVCAGTKIWTHKGECKNIEDLRQEEGIIGYHPIGSIKEPISYMSPPATKPCYRIETSNGGFIECSNDHPLLWSSNKFKKDGVNGKKVTFKRAEDIKVGDQLMRLRQVPNFGSEKMYLPRLVGYLIGDVYYGTYYASSELAVSDKEMLDYLDENGVSYTIDNRKSYENPYYRRITLHHTQIELRKLGIQGQSKDRKRLPSNIWDFRIQDVAEMIGGYFDADGSIVYNKKKNAYSIKLTSVVRPLLEQVQTQLYKFGVSSAIIEKKAFSKSLVSAVNKKTYQLNSQKSYTLEICKIEDVIEFKKHIKFSIKRKQDILDTVDVTRKGTYQTNGLHYTHTLEKKGEFFIGAKMNNLEPSFVKSVEYIGEKPIYNLTADISHTYITNQFISHNTSGDLEGGTYDYCDMFRRPTAFDLLPFKNIWDENAAEETCGFWHGANMNAEGFYDAQGNSDVKGATESIIKIREEKIANGATTTEIQKSMQERPLSPSEAFASASLNNFPVAELSTQLRKVKAGNLQFKMGTPVTLEFDKDGITCKPILDGSAKPITSLQDLPVDKRGCIMIYERPVPNAPKGLYKIGYDPVRQDKGSSLASLVVYKGVHAGSLYHSVIVAEFIGRHELADETDRFAEMLAIYYNTTVMHENEVSTVKNYFRRIKRLDLLAHQPDAVISKNIKKSNVARVYGCHMNEQLKDAGERYVKDWLLTILDYDENEKPIRTIDRIYSQRLLEELIAYNRKGNFDIVSALFMCMFQVQEESLGKVYDTEKRHSKLKNLMEMMETMYR